MALWGGRFEAQVDEFTQRYGASLEVDKNVALEDIAGSRAHAHMLAAQGIISAEDAAAIDAGLLSIKEEIITGTFVYNVNDEDIHMAIESELTRRIGAAGGRLHTGRSRNDQVATDLRLHVMKLARDAMDANLDLQRALLEQAREHTNTILPGYTHLQHAQPVSLAHHLLTYVWQLHRDFIRLQAAYDAASASPLGAAALAGTSYPIDRDMTAHLLGFSRVIPNSLDAVSDRDFAVDLTYACALSMAHLSRLCEEIVLWSSTEFGFITLSDSFSTGSSIMPQKKNPDFAELTRGKSGRVFGDLMSLLTVVKGLTLAYNKDLQETKEQPIDAAATAIDAYRCCAGMISTWTVHTDAMYKEAGLGFTAATDVADYLAKRGLPFREAHEIVGKLVLACEKRGCGLEDLSAEDFHEVSDLFDEKITHMLTPVAVVAARTSFGSTGPDSVSRQLELAQESLDADAQTLAHVSQVAPAFGDAPLG